MIYSKIKFIVKLEKDFDEFQLCFRLETPLNFIADIAKNIRFVLSPGYNE